MSAPLVRMAGRCFYQLYKLSNSAGRIASGKKGIRQFSGSVVQHAAEPWRLLGAACVQRLAVTSEDQRPLEAKFSELMHQVPIKVFGAGDQPVQSRSVSRLGVSEGAC